MSTPINATDLQRLRALVDLIEKTNDPSATMRIWISDDYVSLEVSSTNLPINEARIITGAAPLEADQVEDIVERKRVARNRSAREPY